MANGKVKTDEDVERVRRLEFYSSSFFDCFDFFLFDSL